MKLLSSRNQLRAYLATALAAHEEAKGPLLGIKTTARRDAFVDQLVDSVRRVEYVSAAQRRALSFARRDPESDLFDPVLGAIVCRNAGEHEEALWLLFLAVHCGKHLHDGWSLVSKLYEGDDSGGKWTWCRVSKNPSGFRQWLHDKNTEWQTQGIRPRFGNHRKYVSLSGWGPRGTGAAVETYVRVMEPTGSQQQWIKEAIARQGGDPGLAFDDLYRSLGTVQQFGRLAKFDFLCMLGKCGLANIAPSHAYLADSTGPLHGARLLFGRTGSASNRAAVELGVSLNLGMQVIEDALCNWGKSPAHYKRFRG